MNEGWVKLHRCLMNKAIWTSSTIEQKVVLITLLMMANHKGREWEWKGKKFKANAGQFVTSLDSITRKCGKGITLQNVRTALNKFVKYEFLTQEVTKTGRLINIVNWGLYQDTEKTTNKPINKELTKSSQSTNKELTTNKNDKNVKNDKKYIYIREFTEDKTLIETIIDFMKMRDKIKKPMTDRALKIMLNKLNTLSNDTEIQINILEKSIENCWQGIFALKEDGLDGVNRNRNSGQNTGEGKKKFNIKVPEWKPSEGDNTEDEPF